MNGDFAQIRIPDLQAVSQRSAEHCLNIDDTLQYYLSRPGTIPDILYHYGASIEQSGKTMSHTRSLHAGIITASSDDRQLLSKLQRCQQNGHGGSGIQRYVNTGFPPYSAWLELQEPPAARQACRIE